MDPVAVVFPHQLCRDNPCLKRDRIIYLVEDPWFFGDPVNLLKFHQQKLVLHRASMQAYLDFLQSPGLPCPVPGVSPGDGPGVSF